MTKKPKEPEDLGIKMGSKEEAYLTKVEAALEEERVSCDVTGRLNKQFLDIVREEIIKEREKFK